MMLNYSNILSNAMMKISSSISSNNLMLSSSLTGESVGNTIITFFCKLIYLVCKWILYFVDVLFFFIRQIAGMNTDTSSLEALTSSESDLVFKLINENSTLISQIIRQLVGLAIVVIIVLTIIAIIKTQYEAIRDGKAGDNKPIIANTLKSLLMLLITPAIAIGGIMLSNILLKSLYNATNVTESSSIGSSIFALSSSSANKYRLYAQEGNRIPVYFEFSENEFYLDSIEKAGINQKSYDYLSSEDNPTYQAHLMFEDESFYKFSDLETNTGDYYKYYDTPISGSSDENKRFHAEREEYLVMADLIDFEVKTSSVFYFKTIEDVLSAAKSLPSQDIYRDIVNLYGITDSDDADIIQFASNYYSYDELTKQTGAVKQIQYKHVKGETDELYGAVFVVVKEKTIEIGNVVYTYYEPISYGYRDSNETASFKPEFLKSGNMVVAKGLFTEDGYPTAIRQSNSGDIEFYRDDLKEYSLGDIAGFAQIYKQTEENQNIFSKIIKFFKQIFNPESLIPVIDVNEQAIKVTYKKQTSQVGSLENGRLHISYMFNKSDSFVTSIYTVQLDNFYMPRKLNFLVLVMGSWLLIKVCLTVVFALIKRIYELFLLFIFYPTTCATMPLDGGSGQKQWMTKFTAKLFATYGLILGINIILMFIPIAESIEFFKPEEIAGNTFIRNLSGLFFNLFSYNQIAQAMNLTVAILFELVAFSLLEGSGIVKLMSKLFPGEEDITTNNPANDMAVVVTSMTNVMTRAVKTVTGFAGFVPNVIIPSRRAKLIEKGKSKLEQAIPGNAAMNQLQDMKYRHEKKKEQKEAYKDLEDALDSGNAKEIEAKLKAFTSAQKKYTSTLTVDNGASSVRQQRKAEADLKKNEEFKEFASNSREGDDENSSNNNSYNSYSDDELEKLSKNAKKYEKKNRKKYEKGKLSEEEQAKYEGAKQIAESSEKIIEKRNLDKQDIKQAKQRISELENKKSAGSLTNSEMDELTQLNDKVNEFNQNNFEQSHQYKMRHDSKYRKNYIKTQQEIETKRKLFAHEEKGKYARQQRKVLAEMDKNIVQAEKNLYTQGISTTDQQALNEMLSNDTISQAQKTAIENYKMVIDEKKRLLNIRDERYKNAAAQKARVESAKDKFKITKGKRVRNRQNKARNKNLLNNQNELDEINEEIANLDNGTGGITIQNQRKAVKAQQKLTKRRSELSKRKDELEASIATSNNWNSINNSADISRLKSEQKAQRKRAQYADKHDLNDAVLKILEKKKLPATQQNVEKYTQWLIDYIKDKQKNK